HRRKARQRDRLPARHLEPGQERELNVMETEHSAAGIDSGSPFRSVNTPGFAGLLEDLGITLLVSTYQAGKLMAVRARDGRIATLLRTFERPMGLAVRDPGQFALGTRTQVWFYRDAPDLAPQVP